MHGGSNPTDPHWSGAGTLDHHATTAGPTKGVRQCSASSAVRALNPTRTRSRCYRVTKRFHRCNSRRHHHRGPAVGPPTAAFDVFVGLHPDICGTPSDTDPPHDVQLNAALSLVICPISNDQIEANVQRVRLPVRMGGALPLLGLFVSLDGSRMG